MFALTNLAVKVNNAKDLSGTALRVAEEAVRTDAASASSANLDGPGNGSSSKESGGNEELHLE